MNFTDVFVNLVLRVASDPFLATFLTTLFIVLSFLMGTKTLVEQIAAEMREEELELLDALIEKLNNRTNDQPTYEEIPV